tara:strand:- start:567 stop:1013 length:447 start_codon:yes stop_codon:yes gene_type:complete
MELSSNYSMGNFTNNTNTDTSHLEEYIIGLVVIGPTIGIMFVAICYCIYDKIIKKYLKCYTVRNNPKIIVESIVNPVFIKKINTNNLSEETNCCICLEEINNKQQYISLHCGHVFHQECLMEWIKTQQNSKHDSNCPLCRECIIKIKK